jgi:hypothetical protein
MASTAVFKMKLAATAESLASPKQMPKGRMGIGNASDY